MNKSELKKIIKAILNRTNNCDFKRAFIPEGYAVVRIEEFSKNLSSIIKEKLDER